MRVKICGLTDPAQAHAIAGLGAHALGFICVPASPRYVAAEQLRALTAGLPPFIFKVGVFADAPLEAIEEAVQAGGLNAIQLHGEEEPQVCRDLAQSVPGVARIKALRLREAADLERIERYRGCVETVLLDSWHPAQLGGTGVTFDWQWLMGFKPGLPWILSGGLKPENLLTALHRLQPQAIDLSSGVEEAGQPGRKNLKKVAQVLAIARQFSEQSHVVV
ncbi:phosphoribosylanthranilate isomerase [Gloeobacter kilaueensis]|uniref:N-(5'-phosphoribosyl)anthranilate isomerase n=1 Tax=Gloeobacter kilaueensis (strain ATCC BAA-2537 / CCAP 1431/1 / ULC 316 / JS1) TaxID=1183438 RepID=U5QHH6_GLOK1|nr:phosphoribosylanthranilate isomerase [Gloeobacter kilaueensis]AGY58371.1 N-(5'-phosphoribosyl)anthranilate isomerase [Gloeobacter kilaueensis JS1]